MIGVSPLPGLSQRVRDSGMELPKPSSQRGSKRKSQAADEFMPYANEADVLRIGNLEIENRVDRVSLTGDLVLAMDLKLELTPFHGHLIVQYEGVQNASNQAAVPGAISSTNGRTGASRTFGQRALA